MAIVQISRITQRKGLETDLPQPLAGAELGWAIDQRRLFIGNGELVDGAPVVGNTEILTEFSPILSFATAYTYEGQAAGYTVQTGPTVGTPISQSLQSRLDSFAVVTDFGAKGDGVTDDTAAINRALYQMFCRDTNTQIRRSLYFPAGTYIITDTINVPPYALLYGDGANSSILNLTVQTWTNTVAYATGVLVKNGSSYYRSVADVPAGIDIANTEYWSASTLPAYIMRTADSLQQTGANICTNGAAKPQNISVRDMSLVTDQLINALLIEDAESCDFQSMYISGPLTAANLTTNADATIGVDFASTASLITNHIKVDNCEIKGFTWGINTEEQIQGITISNNQFEDLYQGIYLGGTSPVLGGPTGFTILSNLFDSIYVQGIVIENVSLNSSGFNVFYDVGNHFNGATLPASSIIDIDGDNNVSIGDMFQRTTAYSGSYPRINLNNTISVGMDSAAQLQQGTYVRETGQTQTLLDNTSNQTMVTIDTNVIKAIQINYTIVRATAVRTGVYTIVAGTDGAGTGLATNDTGYQNSSTGVTFSASETAYSLTWKASLSSTGADATINFSVTHLA